MSAIKTDSPQNDAEHHSVGCIETWPEELKAILGQIIDLAARTLVQTGNSLVLNEILTTEELAARFKIPVSTVEELARRGKLPGAFRVGKHWRFDLDSLRASLPKTDDSGP
jgi:excisionase family DNA binding protein